MSSASPPHPSVPSLIQFLETVPPPVTLLLVELSPLISYLRWIAEVVSWKSHWCDPWLFLAGWWIICLSTNVILRYLLPLALLLPVLISHLPTLRVTRPQIHLTTEHLISTSLSDIAIIQCLIPTLPSLPTMPFLTALRLAALLLVPYIILTHFVAASILAGIAGTLLLTYRAPWARTVRSVLGRSAYVRRFLLRLWSHLTGTTTPALASFITNTTDPDSRVLSAPASPPIRFLFTILECQRWWVGLDWTAALLPGERPSWCSVSQQPVLPPGAFSLPHPTTVYLPAREGKRVKRAATWVWEENEWGVWINKEGTGFKRVEKRPPSVEDEGGTRIATKAASLLKERKVSLGSRSETSHAKDDQEESSPTVGTGSEHGGEELATDPEGWVYGDNKWEGAGPKGGIGKYTRYRRWTRVAVLTETVEEVEQGEVGIVKGGEADPPITGPLQEGQEKTKGKESGSSCIMQDPHKEGGEREEGRSTLKHRLQTVIQTGPNTS